MRIVAPILFTLAAIGAGSLLYPGQLSCFLLFSATFFAILYSIFFLPFQYTHLFLAIPWFLGFWLKLVVHFAFSDLGLREAARYVEPAGSFDGSAAAWDQVLVTASIGGIGYLMGRILLTPLLAQSHERSAGLITPSWYRQLRTPLWVLVAAALVGIIYINAETGLIVRGYVPRIQLPWPFGALFSWTTDIGFALVLAILAAWDRELGVGPMRGFFGLCIEGAVISIQTNSRGIYLFHTVPVLVSEARRPIAARPPMRRASLFLAIWLAGAIAIPLITTGLRAFGERVVLAKTAQDDSTPQTAPVAPPPSTAEKKADNKNVTVLHSTGTGAPVVVTNPTRFDLLKSFVIFAFQGASRLIIDRWPGMEGIMAVESFSGRSLDLLRSAALQRRTYGMVDIYTQTIARSDFTEDETKKYHNATIAGPIAFFYYSGSWAIVFGGMALLAILASLLELIWASLVPDSLVTAMSGCYLALVIMQLSTGLVQAASGLVTVTGLLLFVWAIMRLSTGAKTLLPEQARDVA